MNLTTPDYAVLALTLGGAVIGLFIGFSGALAFLCGSVAAAAAGSFAFPLLADEVANPWARGLAVGVGMLLVFGVVRYLVRKFVHGLVAQPGDAIFGSLVSALTGAACSLGVVWLVGTLTGDASFNSALLNRILCLLSLSSPSC